MSIHSLKTKIFIAFIAIIFVPAIPMSLLGYYVIKNDIIDRAQVQVENDLKFAREVYENKAANIENVVRLTALRFFVRDAIISGNMLKLARELEIIRRQESLDILTLTDVSGEVVVRARNNSVFGDDQKTDVYVSKVLSTGRAVSGTAIMAQEELAKESSELVQRASIKIIHTRNAKQDAPCFHTCGMMIKAAAPVLYENGEIAGVLYGGNILNKNFTIVDQVQSIVYRGQKYRGRSIGTVTIFERDVRISTNVRDDKGNRAIGTRVSEDVYNRVLADGLPWVGRAFVVNDWYKSAYEPITGLDGRIVGMLYVGTLEQPFNDIARNAMLVFMAIIGAAMLLAVIISIVLAAGISKPLGNLLKATGKLSSGELGHTVEAEVGVLELEMLAKSFNEMSCQLKERDRRIMLSNEMLVDLNKRYIDLIGFVSHELKGAVGTIMMNVCAVEDEILGQINQIQKKALSGAIRSLDYLTATVKKFLSLGKIEKGELAAKKSQLNIRKDVIEVVVKSLATAAQKKNMRIHNEIDANLRLEADLELMQIAANNLLNNAIKYGFEGGDIVVKTKTYNGRLQIEIYNDSEPIPEQQVDKLFHRFSRLDNLATKSVKGTGLGLFITKQIIEKHGGKIWVQQREKGNSFICELSV